MAPSHVEVNFKRLLGKCEFMVSEAQRSDGKFEWRIEKYLEALSFQLAEIGRQSSKPEDEIMREYKRKVEFLQGVARTEKLQSSCSKVRAYQQLIPVATNLTDHGISNPGNHGNSLSRDIELMAKSRYHKEMRRDLLGAEDEVGNLGLKKRRALLSDGDSTKENIDDIIKHHHEAQEKVAEEMIKMAQSMKHSSIAASQIIKQDKETLENSTKLVDKNFQKLKKESDRLEEMNKRRCSWWLWIMLTIVCVTFILMILFIKFFPARSR